MITYCSVSRLYENRSLRTRYWCVDNSGNEFFKRVSYIDLDRPPVKGDPQPEQEIKVSDPSKWTNSDWDGYVPELDKWVEEDE